MESQSNWVVTMFVALLMGVFGSTAKFLSQLEHIQFSWKKYLISLVVAAFMSVIAGLLCVEYVTSKPLTWVICGLSGASGHALMDLVLKLFVKAVDNKVNKTITNEIGV
jgi:formate hydrogenlyase subunit 4